MLVENEKEKTIKSSNVFEGIVVSDKMDKTITVKINRRFKHPMLGKTVSRFKKYKAHDENNEAKIGDLVLVKECHPVAKTKHMLLVRVLKKA